MREHDVLLRDQSDSDAVTDGGVKEVTDLFRGHVLCAFLKPANQKFRIRGRVKSCYLLSLVIASRPLIVCVVWKEGQLLTLWPWLEGRSRGPVRDPPAAP